MLLLTTVATVVSIKASRRADQDAEKRFALVTAAKQFSTASVDLTRHARSYASTLNTAFLDKYNNEINTYKNRGIPFHDLSGIRLREWMGVSDETFYSEKIAIVPMDFYYPRSRPFCKNKHKKSG